MSDTESLAKRFVAAGSELGAALATQLQAQDPEMAEKLALAMQHGERMMLAIEFDMTEPTIRLVTIDDYQQVKRVMHIRGVPPTALQ
ncbi:MAG TPA: hypothetical protein VNM48_01480 [Chloroflexota bacterium]|nr:hypothetical protein [Chloroflexota bacterium]